MASFKILRVGKLFIDGQQVTATPSQLSAANTVLASVTASVSELNIADGLTVTKSELNLLDSCSATKSELNKLDGCTATKSELNIMASVTATKSELNIIDGVTATTSEINQRCDVSARVQSITSGGSQAVTAGIESVELNSITKIDATIADASAHQGLFIVKQLDGGTAGHTLTLTSGTFDGTNNKAILNAQNEALIIYFLADGNGTIVENVGTVAVGS